MSLSTASKYDTINYALKVLSLLSMALFLTIRITTSQYTKLDIVKFNVTRRELLVIVNQITYKLT